MTEKELRNWLGIYFLLVTSVLGGYLLMFNESKLLPLSSEEATSAFQIVIPVLIGQLTIMFKWFGGSKTSREREINIPKWTVVAPPSIVAVLLVVSLILLIAGNSSETGYSWGLNAAKFKSVITFCVSLLNATTIFVIAKFFRIS